MLYDILDFLALADKSKGLPFSRQTRGLGTAYDIVTPIDPVSGYGQWKHIKGNNIFVNDGKPTKWGGYPWDLRLYDENYIYDWVTEKDWPSGPEALKKFINNHYKRGTGVLDDGVIMLPRYVNEVCNNFVLHTPKARSTYATFVNCKQVGNAQSLGDVTHRMFGPFMIDHSGDVKNQPTLVHQYLWSDNSNPTMEQNFYALNYGLVAWKLLQKDSRGLYTKLLNQTINNVLIPGPVPECNFPCF